VSRARLLSQVKMSPYRVSLSLVFVALVFCLGLAWWASTGAPVVDRKRDAPLDAQVSPKPEANRAISSGRQSPPTWIPTDAERPDDRGAFLKWVPSDAERPDDRGASRTWIATDAERDDDPGAFMTWTATDAERHDDVGITVSAQQPAL
jgi:hypothetical protein